MTAAELLATIPFPDPRAEARQRAAEFQRLTPDERLRDIGMMFRSGMAMIQRNPDREAIQQLADRRKEEWRDAHRAVFLRLGV